MPTKTASACPDSDEASCLSIVHLNDQDLSVSYTLLVEPGCVIHEDTLREIWEKAAKLVADSTLIASVPGSSNSNATFHCMVASPTNSPVILSVMHSIYKACSHTIATAEVTGKLQHFVQWLVKQKCSPNYNNLAMQRCRKKGWDSKTHGKENRKQCLAR